MTEVFDPVLFHRGLNRKRVVPGNFLLEEGK
jgi:hypothetical protein